MLAEIMAGHRPLVIAPGERPLRRQLSDGCGGGCQGGNLVADDGQGAEGTGLVAIVLVLIIVGGVLVSVSVSVPVPVLVPVLAGLFLRQRIAGQMVRAGGSGVIMATGQGAAE
jgi:hypothetical protein